MGGVFSFLGGLLSLGASAGLGIKEDMELEAKNREYKSHNYSLITQSKYDDDIMYLMERCDFEQAKKAVKREYPCMNDMWLYLVTKTVVAKKLMEHDTDYEYYVPEKIERADLKLDEIIKNIELK